MDIPLATQSDHDLLITIHEQVRNVRVDIQEMKNDNTSKIRDHENRIRRLELWGAMTVGGLYVVVAIIGWYLTYKSGH